MDGGTCVAGEACMVGVCGRGHAWQERQPLQRTVCILFECILVLEYILIKHEWALRSKTFLNAVLLDIWGFLLTNQGSLLSFICHFLSVDVHWKI